MLIEDVLNEALESISVAEQSDSCIWLGLSGGVDSTTLLHAAAQYCALNGRNLKAIHVHHGLSENADAWAMQAQILCEKLSQKFSIIIPCIIEKVQLNHRSDGLEQAARAARYQIFEKHCGPNDVLLQGHHLDDQIETFFMRAIRGSGLAGLASIPKQRSLSRKNTCQILRPFLAIEKNELVDYAQVHQLSWVEDESNQDSNIERNWWRNELLPQIWKRYSNKKQSLSRTINTVQHEQHLLQQLITEKINLQHDRQQHEAGNKMHPALNSIPRFDLRLIEKLDKPIALSYLRAWLAQYVDLLPSAIQMHTIYVDMILARVDAEPSFSWIDKSLYRSQNHLFLWQGKCELNDNNKKEVAQISQIWNGDALTYPFGMLTCNKEAQNKALKPATYTIRFWQAGDVAKPVGRSTRKMKKWWQDFGVPSWARNHWPMIVDENTNEIAAVPGLFICQGFLIESAGWSLDWNFTEIMTEDEVVGDLLAVKRSSD